MAKAVAARALEDEATRRAMGWEEPVYNANGEQVGTRWRYSDTMLIVRLKAALPEEYRERTEVQHDLSPAMAALMAVWQELRDHPERAIGLGPGEPMLQLEGHTDWMNTEPVEAEIEELPEDKNADAPTWETPLTASERQNGDEPVTREAGLCSCCGDHTGSCTCWSADWCARCFRCIAHCQDAKASPTCGLPPG